MVHLTAAFVRRFLFALRRQRSAARIFDTQAVLVIHAATELERMDRPFAKLSQTEYIILESRLQNLGVWSFSITIVTERKAMNPEGHSAKAKEIRQRLVNNLANSFSFVYANLRDPNLDAHFLWQVTKEGIILWGDPAIVLEVLARPRAAPYVLVTYSTRGLDAAAKGALHRALYGYQATKRVGAKEYHNARPGLLNRIGRRIAPGVALIPAKAADPLLLWLDTHKVPHTVTKVWT